ncbi:MAG: hypothetical protein ACT4ON_11340 [Bacteroidota bacterium]
MNPIVFNCVLLYLFVVAFSLLQSRLKLIKDSPISFVFVVLVVPFLIYAKTASKRPNLTWTELTGFEILGYTLVISFMNAKRIVPKLNEGFIYAYTLFHWYILSETINKIGFNFILITISIISVYPTFLIIKNAFEDKLVTRQEKIILYYWFLFIIGYTYINEVALNVIQPIFTMNEITLSSIIIIAFSALQLYFISTVLSLLFISVPLFHMDKGMESFSIRWDRAVAERNEILKHKLDNYIEYQINIPQVATITAFSALLFFLDHIYNCPAITTIIYTVLLPLFYFYFKISPSKNI